MKHIVNAHNVMVLNSQNDDNMVTIAMQNIEKAILCKTEDEQTHYEELTVWTLAYANNTEGLIEAINDEGLELPWREGRIESGWTFQNIPFEALKELRKQLWARGIPVTAITGVECPDANDLWEDAVVIHHVGGTFRFHVLTRMGLVEDPDGSLSEVFCDMRMREIDGLDVCDEEYVSDPECKECYGCPYARVDWLRYSKI